jgi:hypothetical protein
LNFQCRNNASNVANFTLDKVTDIANHKLYNRLLHTVVYSFGYTETVDGPLVQILIGAFVKNKRYNILIVDFGAYSSSRSGPPSIPDYLAVIESIKKIGPLVGESLWNAFGSKLTSSFYLIGHSLGAHLSAYINRGIKAATANTQHRRITTIIGLDPAAPIFFPFGNSTTTNQPLKATDADIVLVIHTDKTFFGAPVSIGTTDFWPNGGSNQTNCPAFNAAGFIADINSECYWSL